MIKVLPIVGTVFVFVTALLAGLLTHKIEKAFPSSRNKVRQVAIEASIAYVILSSIMMYFALAYDYSYQSSVVNLPDWQARQVTVVSHSATYDNIAYVDNGEKALIFDKKSKDLPAIGSTVTAYCNGDKLACYDESHSVSAWRPFESKTTLWLLFFGFTVVCSMVVVFMAKPEQPIKDNA